MKTTFLWPGALAALFLFPATAQPADTSGDGLVTSVSLTSLRSILEDQGAVVDELADEATWLSATSSEGLRFRAQPTACESEGVCRGINLLATYTGDDIRLDRINEADVKYSAVSAWTYEGAAGFSRYLILDKGMTRDNIIFNIDIFAQITPLAYDYSQQDEEEESSASASSSIADLQYGDDTGSYANDGTCDDARFAANGDEFNFKRKHVLRDATDCRDAVRAGTVSLLVDFGDDSGDYANDGICDDNRFTGEGRSILTTDSQVRRDASDCVLAYQTGKLNR